MAKDNSDLLREIVQRLEGVRGPRSNGWYKARCPFPEHSDRKASFGFTKSGYLCHGCGRRGGLRHLGSELGISLPEHGNGARLTAADAEERLMRRGVRKETIEHFAIVPDERKQAWRFPVSGAQG